MKTLSEQRTFEEQFDTWFNSGLKTILDDNRRRYRMELRDKDQRESRGLSALPSTKSTSVVDRAVEKALLEYHGEPDAITFTSKSPLIDPAKDEQAAWLTQLFNYRAKRTFPFFTWHSSSLTNAFTDGLEAAMVYWRKESYTEKGKEYVYTSPETGETVPVTKEAFDMGNKLTPGFFEEIVVTKEEVVRDNWWIDSLKPGEELLWDIKTPLLDLNLGEACLVKLHRSLQELVSLADSGAFNKFNRKKAENFRSTQSHPNDPSSTVSSPGSVDLDDLNRICVWAFFEKVDGQWMVQFSLEGKEPLSSPKAVNDVYFNGRRVNRLPIVLGTHKMKLWEALGRGEPETIAPLEDELVQHKNNVADAAKIAIQGRYRVDRDADINFDNLLNGRVVLADNGEFEKIDQQFNTVDSLRVADVINAEVAELVSVGMESKHLVPRGTGKTLGAVELALGHQNEKLSVQLLCRNQTFFEPLLYLIAQLEFAYETDETILRIAARNAGVNPPIVIENGQAVVDLQALDFDAEVQINAGLGSAPRAQKAQNIIQLATFRQSMGIATDMDKVASQLNVLAGFEPGAFSPSTPPAPPQPEMSGNVNIDLAVLPPELQMTVLQLLLTGPGQLNANIQAIQQQGGSGANVGAQEADLVDDPLNSSGGVEQGGQGGY